MAVTRVRFRALEPRRARLVPGHRRVARARRRLRDPGPGAALVEEIEGDYWNVVGPAGAALCCACCPALLQPALDCLAVDRARLPTGARRTAGPSASRCCRRRRLSSPLHANGLFLLPHRHGRPRHGRRSRDRQHARLRARARHRAVRALGGGDRLAHRRGARRRHRGQAHARPHARHDPGDPPAQGRRDRRLRRDRADAAPLHPEGAPEPLGAPARGGLRALGRDRGREARGRGGLPVAPAPARPT